MTCPSRSPGPGARRRHDADLIGVQRRAAARQRQRRLPANCRRPERDRRAGATPRPRAHGQRHGARGALLILADPRPGQPRADDWRTWPDGRRALDGRGQPHPELDARAPPHAAAGGHGWRIVGDRQTLSGPDARRAAPRHRQLRARPHRRAAGPALCCWWRCCAPAPTTSRSRRRRCAIWCWPLMPISGALAAHRRHQRQRAGDPQPFPTVFAAAARRHAQRAARHRAGNRASARRWAIPTRPGSLKVALIVAQLTPAGTMEYAGVHETEMYFSASLLKVAMLYRASSSKRRSTSSRPICPRRPRRNSSSACGSSSQDHRAFGGAHQRAGQWRTTRVQEVLRALPTGRTTSASSCIRRMRPTSGRSSPCGTKEHRAARHPCTASAATSTVRSKRAAFQRSANGIWTTADYGDWPDFHVPVATRGSRPERNSSSSAAMTALAIGQPARAPAARHAGERGGERAHAHHLPGR